MGKIKLPFGGFAYFTGSEEDTKEEQAFIDQKSTNYYSNLSKDQDEVTNDSS